MGIFRRKSVIDRITDAIKDYCKNDTSEENNIIFLRSKNTANGMTMEDGTVHADMRSIPRMLFEAAKGDETFSKCLITASESLKFLDPEMRKFAEGLEKAGKAVGERAEQESDNIEGEVKSKIEEALRKKFPNADVMSINLSEIDNLPKDEFDQMIERLFKRTFNGGSGPDKN